MTLRIDVALHERAILNVNERPVRYLRPGRHWELRALLPGFCRVTVTRFDLRKPAVVLTAEQLALVPAGDVSVFTLAEHERAIVRYRGRPLAWLGAVEHTLWTAERLVRTRKDGTREERPAVEVEILDTSAVAAPVFAENVRGVISNADHAEVLVPEGSSALRLVDGALDAVLGPGRHAAWTTVRKVAFRVADLRDRELAVNGQEVMTKDRVTLRLNLTAVFRIEDRVRFETVARDPEAILYRAMQLVAREAVASRTLDELLAERRLLGDSMEAGIAERAKAVGLALLGFGLKDIVLPGEMKAILNRVTSAAKEAEANVILRREETAATRSLAQTAKLLQDNPLLLRLKELESWKEIANRVGEVKLVLGKDALPAFGLREE